MKTVDSVMFLKYPEWTILWFWFFFSPSKNWNQQFFDSENFRQLEQPIVLKTKQVHNSGLNLSENFKQPEQPIVLKIK
jgi:hypothetical protein